MKIHTLTVFLILLLLPIANSATVLEYNETDLVNLRPVAADPDGDELEFFFERPLSTKGTWQTNYGDEGIYNTKVTVSDGRMVTVENITLVIHKKEESPVIEILSPDKESIYIKEGNSAFFNILATDVNKDELEIKWLFDGKANAHTTYYNYEPGFYEEGNHTLEVVVTDGVNTISKLWGVEVEDVDRSELLDEVISVTVNEDELVRLPLPDFARYDLKYNISKPLNRDGSWKTTYDDAGVYDVLIQMWDDVDFIAVKKIKVLVENVDRKAVLTGKDSFWLYENSEFELRLNFTDPDGDSVTLEAYNMPQDAWFVKDMVYWTPSFDSATKENIIDKIASKFHAMNKVYEIYINASSQNLTTTQKISLRVFDTNRAPFLESIDELKVTAGEIINFEIIATDPDNDTLLTSFDGIGNGYQTSISDVGTHSIKVTVSDGFLDVTKKTKLTVLESNVAPTIKTNSPEIIHENENIILDLEPTDLNGDKVTLSSNPMPKGAYFKDGKFHWTPDFDTVVGTQEETFYFEFMAFDEEYNVSTSQEITVKNINRAPQLTSYAQVNGVEFYLDEEVSFYVDIFDPDSDELSYNWRTSLFNSFEAGNEIKVKFDSAGKKTVQVTVSDGKETLKKEWDVIIKNRPKLKIIRV